MSASIFRGPVCAFVIVIAIMIAVAIVFASTYLRRLRLRSAPHARASHWLCRVYVREPPHAACVACAGAAGFGSVEADPVRSSLCLSLPDVRHPRLRLCLYLQSFFDGWT